MNDIDLEELGRMWRRDGAPADLAVFQRQAAKARLRALLLDRIELALGGMLVMAILFALIMAPGAASIAVCLLTALAIGFAGWRRHVQVVAAGDIAGETREQLIDGLIRQADARRKRAIEGLWSVIPGLVLGAAVSHLAAGDRPDAFAEAFVRSMLAWPAGVVTLGAVIGLGVWLFVQHRRSVSEVGRLGQLARAYRAEARQEG